MSWIKRRIRAVFASVESALDAAIGPQLNPLCQLGALGWFLFWIVTASGIYLYVFFDTGVVQAYQSTEALTHDQWWAGGIMRSFHRYASDALVLVAGLHLLREFGLDRMRGKRWFAWVTGLATILFLYVCGITGYWMVWDRLAQYVALTTTQWLDALPIFAEPIARNFLDNASLSGRFFTLMVYVHIAAPLLMLLVMWIHIQRYNHARVNPPRRLMYAVLGGFTLLALLAPAVSQPPADLDQLPTRVGLDWFYLAPYPLVDRLGAGTMWVIVALAMLLLALLPWLPRQRPAPVAEVHLDNCNGCARCFADCPFSAITMRPRTDGSAFREEAVVDADLCVSCGICVGACPTATPFRRASALVPGIELPGLPIERLREQVEQACTGQYPPLRAVVFRCAHAAPLRPAATERCAVIDLPCVAMLPPPFIDYIVHDHLADGVMLAGCEEGDCFNRLGIRWTQQRMAGVRDPYLRERVPRERLGYSWSAQHAAAGRVTALTRFCDSLAALPPLQRGDHEARRPIWRAPGRRLPRWRRLATWILLLLVPAGLLGEFSAAPSITLLGPQEAVISLSFSHAGKRRQECRPLTSAQRARMQPNMQRPTDCPRGRWPVYVELELDHRLVYSGLRQPAGLWQDGVSSMYRRLRVPAGPQQLNVRLRDSGRAGGFDFQASRSVELRPGQNLVVEFDPQQGFEIR
jgi:quinol-cytochrome oxidoreductase complex cytochrome b subunit/Fe-S-cluster-containing hydrogenase component 2/coenzyme F420-reducing hydrogenase delta subunit